MTQPAVNIVKHLVETVTKVYQDHSNTSYEDVVKTLMGPDFVGPKLESVVTMIDRVQGALLHFFTEMGGHTKLSCMQGPSKVGCDIHLVSAYTLVRYTSASSGSHICCLLRCILSLRKFVANLEARRLLSTVCADHQNYEATEAGRLQ